jgi:hypothetical protein
MNTINTDPHPLSITANGGNNIESNTLQKLISTKLRLIFHLISPEKYLLLQLLIYTKFVSILVLIYEALFICKHICPLVPAIYM